MKLWKKIVRVLVGILTLGLTEITFAFGQTKGEEDQKAAFEAELQKKRELDNKLIKEQQQANA